MKLAFPVLAALFATRAFAADGTLATQETCTTDYTQTVKSTGDSSDIHEDDTANRFVWTDGQKTYQLYSEEAAPVQDGESEPLQEYVILTKIVQKPGAKPNESIWDYSVRQLSADANGKATQFDFTQEAVRTAKSADDVVEAMVKTSFGYLATNELVTEPLADGSSIRTRTLTKPAQANKDLVMNSEVEACHVVPAAWGSIALPDFDAPAGAAMAKFDAQFAQTLAAKKALADCQAGNQPAQCQAQAAAYQKLDAARDQLWAGLLKKGDIKFPANAD